MPMDHRDMTVKTDTGLVLQRGRDSDRLDGSPNYWWEQTTSLELAGAIDKAGQHIETQQLYRTSMNLRHSRIYGNFDAAGFGVREYTRSRTLGSANLLTWNVIAAGVDTVHAKVSKAKPRASFQTFGGDWGKQRKAMRLDKFCQGIAYETKLYQSVSPLARLDALTLGTGVAKVFADFASKKVRVERVFPEELLVDDADGIHGAPRQLFQRKAIAREVLLAQYGSRKKDEDEDTWQARRLAIIGAITIDGSRNANASFGDMVRVWECWHLASGPDIDDGRHSIAIKGAVLEDEKWDKDHYPLAFVRYHRPQLGFWGRGMAERGWGIQVSLNRTLRSMDENIRLHGNGKWLVANDSDVDKNHLRGGEGAVGDIVTYNRTRPELVVPQGMTGEYFMHAQRLWDKFFEQEGISQLSAAAKKPAGLNSGAAIREYEDIEDERHLPFGQDDEQFHMDIFELAIEAAKELVEQFGEYETVAPIRKVLQPVKWSEIQLERDQYVMQAFPVSSLPATPSARMQVVDEWVQRGWISAEEAPRLMNMPDLEEATSLMNAALDDVYAAIEDVLEGGEAEAPEEFENLDMRVSHGMAAWLRARRQGAPQRVLLELFDYVDLAAQAKARKQAVMQAAQAATAPPTMPGGPAGAPPGAGNAPNVALPPGPPPPTLQ